MKELASEYAMNHKQQDRSNTSVMQMVISAIAKGEQSDYLRQPTPAEVKRLTGEQLLALFNDVQKYDCDVLYCGTHTKEDVAALCRQYLPLNTAHTATPDNDIRCKEYGEPMVYIYDMPDSRQTYVGVYGSVSKPLTEKEEALLKLWNQYMGGSMNSVLFQEIREFRSMAYATGSYCFTPNRARHNDHPSGYIAYLGTQGDKTMQALFVLDSLMQHMPVNEHNVASSRQEIMNDINTSYPSFRQLPHFVSSYRADGYRQDPRTNIALTVPTLTTDEMLAVATGRPREEVNEATEVDMWMTPEEAVDFGIADSILTY
jgi:predicted Zn-dependent peptidase